jgi:MFS transporter, DHA1 family, multidrug resistance protein
LPWTLVEHIDTSVRMQNRLLVIICGVMLSLNAISCEILLPSFFTLERVFAVDRAAIEFVIPIFLMSAACGQIIFGPLSDRFGRKPLMLVGVAIYTMGSLSALLAPTLTAVYGARVLQGLGAACLIVVARATMRDVYSGHALGQAMATVMGIFTIGPVFGPLIGISALWLGGWHGPFVGMTLIGVALMATIALKFRETLTTPDVRALEPARLFGAAKRLFSHPQSRHFLIILAIMQLVIVLFISTAPAMFRTLGATEGWFAVYFSMAACGILVGQGVNKWLLNRFSVLQATKMAAIAVVVGALATVAAAPNVALWGYIALLFVFNAAFLIVMGNSITLVLDPHREIAGIASAILGFGMQFTGSMIALLILPRLDGTLVGWAIVNSSLQCVAMLLVLMFRPAHAATEAT